MSSIETLTSTYTRREVLLRGIRGFPRTGYEIIPEDSGIEREVKKGEDAGIRGLVKEHGRFRLFTLEQIRLAWRGRSNAGGIKKVWYTFAEEAVRADLIQAVGHDVYHEDDPVIKNLLTEGKEEYFRFIIGCEAALVEARVYANSVRAERAKELLEPKLEVGPNTHLFIVK